MTRWATIRHLVVRTVLALFIYNTSAWLVGKVAYGIEYLLAWLGDASLWNVLHAHPFAKSVGVGIAAGFIPFQLWLTLSGFIRAEVPEFLEKLNLERMKSWMVVLYSPILAISVLGWVDDWIAMRARTMTVLQDSSTMPVWRMFDGFFSTNCRNVSDYRLDLWTDNFAFQCTMHVLIISTFLTAAGYSLTPWIKSRIPRKTWTEDLTIEEAAQAESDPLNSHNSKEKAQ